MRGDSAGEERVEMMVAHRLGGGKWSDKKIERLADPGLRWPPIIKKTHNNQPKTMAAMEGTKDGRRDEREARGKRNTIILGGD